MEKQRVVWSALFCQIQNSYSVTGSGSPRGGLTSVAEVAASCSIQKWLSEMPEIHILLTWSEGLDHKELHEGLSVEGKYFLLGFAEVKCVFFGLGRKLCPGWGKHGWTVVGKLKLHTWGCAAGMWCTPLLSLDWDSFWRKARVWKM